MAVELRTHRVDISRDSSDAHAAASAACRCGSDAELPILNQTSASKKFEKSVQQAHLDGVAGRERVRSCGSDGQKVLRQTGQPHC
eukprot:6185165-Pleurochrysis_carterae.AAC.2